MPSKQKKTTSLPFVQVPVALLDHGIALGIASADLPVVLMMLRFRGATLEVWPSITTLARMLGRSRSTVQLSVTRLVRGRIIELVQPGTGGSLRQNNHYDLRPLFEKLEAIETTGREVPFGGTIPLEYGVVKAPALKAAPRPGDEEDPMAAPGTAKLLEAETPVDDDAADPRFGELPAFGDEEEELGATAEPEVKPASQEEYGQALSRMIGRLQTQIPALMSASLQQVGLATPVPSLNEILQVGTQLAQDQSWALDRVSKYAAPCIAKVFVDRALERSGLTLPEVGVDS